MISLLRNAGKILAGKSTLLRLIKEVSILLTNEIGDNHLERFLSTYTISQADFL
jgi:hypothetical protein